MIFEENTIGIWTYNIETVLAEKVETILQRGELNTRLRDYYDIYGPCCMVISIDGIRGRIVLVLLLLLIVIELKRQTPAVHSVCLFELITH